ncbi:MAG: hypothetical protein J6J26_03705 [Bacteroides sp.]|nr:hypothetical protein [Bacteroides sp.]
MKNEWIKASKERVVAWGSYLVDTFKKLGLSNNKVIRECHIGRRTFYKMKKGKPINADAYVRLTIFALEKIKERESGQHPPPITEEGWKKQFWKIVTERDSPICGHQHDFLL